MTKNLKGMSPRELIGIAARRVWPLVIVVMFVFGRGMAVTNLVSNPATASLVFMAGCSLAEEPPDASAQASATAGGDGGDDTGPTGPECDRDQDGYDSVVTECGGDDCDDFDAGVHPGAEDVPYDGIDQDCDGILDNDQDDDGFDASPWGQDCDDSDPAVNPDAEEIPGNEVDEDCDEEFGGDTGTPPDYDVDNDTYIDINAGGDDCDDTDPGVNPGQSEVVYNNTDEDCDGLVDNDQDNDGFDGTPWGQDCVDTDAGINPGAPEVEGDGVDQDCDGSDLDYDGDDDGYDNVFYGGNDCDDTDAGVNPGEAEVWYDGIDQDCSGGNDFDQDGDTYIVEAYGGDDCDDTDAGINPGAVELALTDVDENCADGDSGLVVYAFHDENLSDGTQMPDHYDLWAWFGSASSETFDITYTSSDLPSPSDPTDVLSFVVTYADLIASGGHSWVDFEVAWDSDGDSFDEEWPNEKCDGWVFWSVPQEVGATYGSASSYESEGDLACRLYMEGTAPSGGDADGVGYDWTFVEVVW